METKLSIQPYFDLLNSFWEGSNKYFNSKNLKKIGEKSKENPAKNFAANLLLAKHSFQAETFEKCISKYKELLNIIENVLSRYIYIYIYIYSVKKIKDW